MIQLQVNTIRFPFTIYPEIGQLARIEKFKNGKFFFEWKAFYKNRQLENVGEGDIAGKTGE